MSTLLQEACEAFKEVSCGLYAVYDSIKAAAPRDEGGEITDYILEGRLYLLREIYESLQSLARDYTEIEQDLLKERSVSSCHLSCHSK